MANPFHTHHVIFQLKHIQTEINPENIHKQENQVTKVQLALKGTVTYKFHGTTDSRTPILSINYFG